MWILYILKVYFGRVKSKPAMTQQKVEAKEKSAKASEIIITMTITTDITFCVHTL